MPFRFYGQGSDTDHGANEQMRRNKIAEGPVFEDAVVPPVSADGVGLFAAFVNQNRWHG